MADSLDEGEADPAPQPAVGHDELLLQVDLLQPEPSEGEGGAGGGGREGGVLDDGEGKIKGRMFLVQDSEPVDYAGEDVHSDEPKISANKDEDDIDDNDDVAAVPDDEAEHEGPHDEAWVPDLRLGVLEAEHLHAQVQEDDAVRGRAQHSDEVLHGCLGLLRDVLEGVVGLDYATADQRDDPCGVSEVGVFFYEE